MRLLGPYTKRVQNRNVPSRQGCHPGNRSMGPRGQPGRPNPNQRQGHRPNQQRGLEAPQTRLRNEPLFPWLRRCSLRLRLEPGEPKLAAPVPAAAPIEWQECPGLQPVQLVQPCRVATVNTRAVKNLKEFKQMLKLKSK